MAQLSFFKKLQAFFLRFLKKLKFRKKAKVMLEDTRKRLAMLFEAAPEPEASGEAVFSNLQASRRRSLLEFDNIQRNIIRKSMDEVGREIREYGHDYRITTRELNLRHEMNGSPRIKVVDQISFLMLPSYIDHTPHSEERFPRITFEIKPHLKKIWRVKGSTKQRKKRTVTPCESPGCHEYGLEDITMELVEKEILTTIEEFFTLYRPSRQDSSAGQED